jgi:hypothetical protein
MSKINLRGISVEQRVLAALQKLEETGFARSITGWEKIDDWNKTSQLNHISLILHTQITDLNISIAFKSQLKPISVEDFHKIKRSKAAMPERNISWLVIEGPTNKNVRAAARSVGITLYPIDKLESIISEIYKRFKRSNLNELRTMTAMIFQLQPALCFEFEYEQHLAERKILTKLRDVLPYLNATFDKI